MCRAILEGTVSVDMGQCLALMGAGGLARVAFWRLLEHSAILR